MKPFQVRGSHTDFVSTPYPCTQSSAWFFSQTSFIWFEYPTIATTLNTYLVYMPIAAPYVNIKKLYRSESEEIYSLSPRNSTIHHRDGSFKPTNSSSGAENGDISRFGPLLSSLVRYIFRTEWMDAVRYLMGIFKMLLFEAYHFGNAVELVDVETEYITE